MTSSRCCMRGETMVCRSRLDCHRRCGIDLGAGAGTEAPPPPPRATAAEKGWFLVAAILFLAVAVSAQLLGAALS